MGQRQRSRKVFGACILSFLLVGLIFIASMSLANHVVTKPEDIRNTKHYFIANPDVVSSTTMGAPGGVGTTEVCIFCHTPHGANPENIGQVPIWNRAIPLAADFTVYSAPNFDGSGITSTSKPKGVSLACLSCHDGTIAIDALINAAGSGRFEVDNRTIVGSGSGGGSISSYTIDGPGIDLGNSTMRGDVDVKSTNMRNDSEGFTTSLSPFSGGRHDFVTGGGAVGVNTENMTPFPNLTQNLADDHPISMEVPAENFSSEPDKRDPQFAPIGANSPPASTTGNSVKFITRSAGIMPNDIRDRLRAYPSFGQGFGYFIECASCHNPHTPRVNFLRLPSYVPRLVETSLDPSTPITAGIYKDRPWAQYPNNGSAVCLSCHAK